MYSTVVGSFPTKIKEPVKFKDKLLLNLNLYDPYKLAIKNAVFKQLDAGIDIISDGQVRGDMITSFTKYIPGMALEDNNAIIKSKIKKPINDISIKDLQYAKKLIKKYYGGDIPQDKGIKGIITGPSTIVFSSRISGFYKNKDDAIIDLANSLKYEVISIAEKIRPKYIQIDEPFLSTGMVNMNTAKKAIDIIADSVDVPISMHVCGDLTNVFSDLTNFNVDILDFEFAGNNTNLDVLRKNSHLIKNKKIGFGCVDTTLNDVDSSNDVANLIKEGIDIIGKDNIILDPDCGLRRLSPNIAFEKLQLISKTLREFS